MNSLGGFTFLGHIQEWDLPNHWKTYRKRPDSPLLNALGCWRIVAIWPKPKHSRCPLSFSFFFWDRQFYLLLWFFLFTTFHNLLLLWILYVPQTIRATVINFLYIWNAHTHIHFPYCVYFTHCTTSHRPQSVENGVHVCQIIKLEQAKRVRLQNI